MKKIRIISNPYTKDTTFQVYDSDNNDWQNITIETDPNSKLISDEINKSFFPFKAKEIITYIVKEYGIGEDALEIVFKGTLDHFNEVEKICELLDTKCNITSLLPSTTTTPTRTATRAGKLKRATMNCACRKTPMK